MPKPVSGAVPVLTKRIDISSIYSDTARQLIRASGQDRLETLGIKALRGVVTDVLCGVNLRNATEPLTRQRLALLNAAILNTYIRLAEADLASDEVLDIAYAEYRQRSSNDPNGTLLRWMLGLTQKQVQNVLRSDEAAWDGYLQSLKRSIEVASASATDDYGELPLSISGGSVRNLGWSWAISLMITVGSQTLATRGSEKSLYGKLFEKLVMASMLSTLGFRLVGEETWEPRSFWLSSREGVRESDATAIWFGGRGVRFDIGFIGGGNPEITLDKVTRYQREIEISGRNIDMGTIIIVDHLGVRSSVPKLAEQVGGVVIQMSSNDWGVTLGKVLEEMWDDFVSPFRGLTNTEYRQRVERGTRDAPLESIFQDPKS